jgi:hypothetical protein
MSTSPAALKVFDREFLALRSHLLEVAAILDRIERTDGTLTAHERYEPIRRSLEILVSGDPDRARRVQLLFSLPYEEKWRGP